MPCDLHNEEFVKVHYAVRLSKTVLETHDMMETASGRDAVGGR